MTQHPRATGPFARDRAIAHSKAARGWLALNSEPPSSIIEQARDTPHFTANSACSKGSSKRAVIACAEPRTEPCPHRQKWPRSLQRRNPACRQTHHRVAEGSVFWQHPSPIPVAPGLVPGHSATFSRRGMECKSGHSGLAFRARIRRVFHTDLEPSLLFGAMS